MKFVTAVFDYPGTNEYTRCLSALSNSIEANCKGVKLETIRLDPPKPVGGLKQGWINNYVKLKAYSKVVMTGRTVFVDADTVVLRPPFDLFDGSFDVGIPLRPVGSIAPYNCGVMLFSGTKESQEFMQLWMLEQEKMLLDRDHHQAYRRVYRGMNQAAIGALLENGNPRATVRKFPTRIINACEQDWKNLSEARILHVKTRLRSAALSTEPLHRIHPHLREGTRIWRHYENNSQRLVR